MEVQFMHHLQQLKHQMKSNKNSGIVCGDKLTLSLNNIEINNVTATVDGGGIWIGNDSTLNFTNVKAKFKCIFIM